MPETTDRDLIRLYWPANQRPAFDALFAIDDVMGGIVASSSQGALGAIRLAWWREALTRLDVAPPPAEPRLQAAVRQLLPLGVSGRSLAGLEDGWAAMLDAKPWDEAAIAERGRRLFAIGARLLGGPDERLDDAGAVAALASAMRLCDDRDEGERLNGLARAFPRHRFDKRLRPLTALTTLARRDLTRFPFREAEATPGRAATLLWHRISGRA